jgi:hypothetical protein
MAINNAVSDALRAVLGSLGGIVNGTNPLAQPQIGQFVGINIPGVPLVSTRDYFLAQLNSWVSTPALQSQWIAVIESFPTALASSIIRNLERTAGSSLAWNIDIAKTLLTSFALQRVIGCVFCNGFEMPQEMCNVGTAVLENNRGFIPGIISGDRTSYADNLISIKFLDNNTSFIDNIIRPWVILASHYGHVTRKDSRFKITTNITLLSYAKTFQNISMIPRKVFRFYNCVPVQVSSQDFEYEEPNTTSSGTARFSYTNYTIENGLYLPLPQIIAAINRYRK